MTCPSLFWVWLVPTGSLAGLAAGYLVARIE